MIAHAWTYRSRGEIIDGADPKTCDHCGELVDHPIHEWEDTMTRRYTAAELRDLPTLSVGQADDLKIDTGDGTRVWLSRMTVEDGMPHDNMIYAERYIDGRWVTVKEYPGGES